MLCVITLELQASFRNIDLKKLAYNNAKKSRRVSSPHNFFQKALTTPSLNPEFSKVCIYYQKVVINMFEIRLNHT
jgi:hypothetical protein